MTISTDDDPREVLAGRLVDGLTGAMETLGVYLGIDLGLYRALDDLGEATEAEVAGQAGVAPRYAREWLEQQAVAGYLACDDPALPAAQRRYRLPDGHAEVLVDADSPWYVAPLALTLAGGSVLVADERVAEVFTAPGDATERLMYGWSILHCLPATLAEDPVEATGTVLRAPTLARWAAAAGFTGFEVLTIDNPFWRFYRLRG